MRRLIVLAISTVLLSCALPGASVATTYRTYGLDPPGAVASPTARINNPGEVVAFQLQAGGTWRMFFYNPVTTAQYAGAELTFNMRVYDISDSRHIVWDSHLWDPVNGTTELGSLGHGTHAISLNGADAVVGWSGVGPVQDHAFYWTRSAGIQDMGTLGGTNSCAVAINDAGQVVGRAQTSNNEYHAFIWSPGGAMQDLGTLGGPRSEAYGINGNGLVVGVSDIDDQLTKAIFLWDSQNGMRPIFTWSAYYGDTWTPWAINDSGWIAGSTRYGGTGSGRAFVWDPAGGLSILGPGAAYDINNSGWITGASTNVGSVLWVPIPEPSSLAALALALAMAAGARRFGRRRG